MVDDGGDQRDLAETHDRVLVRADDGVVSLGAQANERSIKDVHEQEEEDRDTGNTVEDPGPHSFSTAVQSAR